MFESNTVVCTAAKDFSNIMLVKHEILLMTDGLSALGIIVSLHGLGLCVTL